jgi:L-rhamnose mutarotase
MFTRTINVIVLVSILFIAQGCSQMNKPVRRFGQVAMINPENVAKYKKLHAKVWPEVVAGLEKYKIDNYSIFLKELEEDKPFLFGYFEYGGQDFDGDMAKMMENPTVQKWEDTAGGECLVDQSDDGKGIWWVDMEEVFYHAGQTGKKVDESKVQRYGMVIGLRPEMVDPYKLLHKYTWPEILNKLTEGNIRNYAIYLYQINSKFYLFSYFEYVGDNFAADMAIVDGDPATVAWMKFTDQTCQLPVPTRTEGEWWAMMQEIFHY